MYVIIEWKNCHILALVGFDNVYYYMFCWNLHLHSVIFLDGKHPFTIFSFPNYAEVFEIEHEILKLSTKFLHFF